MIVISFDDAINNNNYRELDRFLSGKLKNPNGCDIKATFFVSHRYNNYSMAQVSLYLFEDFLTFEDDAGTVPARP